MIWSTLSLVDKEIYKIHDLTYDLLRDEIMIAMNDGSYFVKIFNNGS